MAIGLTPQNKVSKLSAAMVSEQAECRVLAMHVVAVVSPMTCFMRKFIFLDRVTTLV